MQKRGTNRAIENPDPSGQTSGLVRFRSQTLVRSNLERPWMIERVSLDVRRDEGGTKASGFKELIREPRIATICVSSGTKRLQFLVQKVSSSATIQRRCLSLNLDGLFHSQRN